MTRITAVDVRGMFTRLVRTARTAGIDTNGWSLEHNNNGPGWRLMRDGGSAGVFGAGGWLGATAREAFDALRFAADALDLVNHPHPATPAGRKLLLSVTKDAALKPGDRVSYASDAGNPDRPRATVQQYTPGLGLLVRWDGQDVNVTTDADRMALDAEND